MRAHQVPQRLAELQCPTYESTPWTPAPAKPRVAIVSTAGLMHRGDEAFSFNAADYRIIDSTRKDDVVMSHISTNFDRTGYARDLNLIFPVDRLEELAHSGDIDSIARYHYSFMGATEPATLEPAAKVLATALHKDEVNTVLLVPV